MRCNVVFVVIGRAEAEAEARVQCELSKPNICRGVHWVEQRAVSLAVVTGAPGAGRRSGLRLDLVSAAWERLMLLQLLMAPGKWTHV